MYAVRVRLLRGGMRAPGLWSDCCCVDKLLPDLWLMQRQVNPLSWCCRSATRTHPVLDVRMVPPHVCLPSALLCCCCSYCCREGIEDVVLSKRRFTYEQQLSEEPLNYDTWFDYVKLEESTGNVDRIREVRRRVLGGFGGLGFNLLLNFSKSKHAELPPCEVLGLSCSEAAQAV